MIEISFDTKSPPSWSTNENFNWLSCITEALVCPPPISMRTVPNSLSPGVNATWLIANGWITISSIFKPALSIQRLMLCTIVLGPVIMLANNSRRTPIIPRGSLIPSNPSTINSSGITEIISRSGATERTFAAEITLYTSTSVISLFSLDTAIIPWQGSIEI